MKIELLIAPYLLTYKTLSLQDIGTFHVTQDLVLPTEQDKGTHAAGKRHPVRL